ncbi:hypothetical protein [Hymenobacter sp.]|uniref:hypothetical protein n=1 Tax=Hymenobacter sp. TaxID=1898978 RepID=UPI00286CDBC0|nr:hypothetical protein [Hymenobacter sp.]
MKKLCVFVLLVLSACQSQPTPVAHATDQVNVLVGNQGYLAIHGQLPAAGTNDDARVQAHLAYAERVLRQCPTAGLDPALVNRRQQMLDLLRRYWTAGVFPRNYDHPGERRPCFIDRDGRLCAVGYLVAETAGRRVAARINQAHQYDLIADMRAPELAAWVRASGLTLAECALIQPQYPGPPIAPTEVRVTTSYAVGSAIWGGVNAMFAVANATQFNQPSPGRGAAYAGALSGTGQILFGAFHLPTDQAGVDYFGWGGRVPGRSYAAERAVSFLNIGAGTATLALSAWNLISHRQAALGRTAVGVVNFPGPAGGAGLSLKRRF